MVAAERELRTSARESIIVERKDARRRDVYQEDEERRNPKDAKRAGSRARHHWHRVNSKRVLTESIYNNIYDTVYTADFVLP
jgi:hypothetical protein